MELGADVHAKPIKVEITILDRAVAAQNRRAVLLLLQAGAGDDPAALERALKRAELASNQSSNIAGLLQVYRKVPRNFQRTERLALI